MTAPAHDGPGFHTTRAGDWITFAPHYHHPEGTNDMRKLLLAAIAALTISSATSISCKANNSSDEHLQCCPGSSGHWSLPGCCYNGCYVNGSQGAGSHVVEEDQCEPYLDTDYATEGGVGGDTATLTLSSGPDTNADSGGECMPDEGLYACHGWVAGVYRRKTNPDSMTILGFSDPTRVNAECYGGGNSIQIPLMYQEEGENDYLLAECRDKCKELLADGQWTWTDFPNPDGSIWEPYKIVCVSEPDGNNGAIPEGLEGTHDGLNPVTGASELCAWVGKTGDPLDHDPIQVVYLGPPEDDQCAPAPVCTGWQPSTSISHSLSGTTHTVTIDDAFLYDLLHDDGWRTALACDDGSFQQIFNGSGVESWKMVNLTSGDLWYALGFRTGDYDLKVKKTVGGTYQSLNSYPSMAAAFDLLYPQETAITVQFKRPCVGTCFPTTHTTNITIN